MTARRWKSNFSPSPRKGTKAREFLLKALRAEGITPAELLPYKPNLSQFINDCGWDVRTFPNKDVNRGGRVVYRVIGKMKWDGSYRSLI